MLFLYPLRGPLPGRGLATVLIASIYWAFTAPLVSVSADPTGCGEVNYGKVAISGNGDGAAVAEVAPRRATIERCDLVIILD